MLRLECVSTNDYIQDLVDNFSREDKALRLYLSSSVICSFGISNKSPSHLVTTDSYYIIRKCTEVQASGDDINK
jgi:hypothetical protein